MNALHSDLREAVAQPDNPLALQGIEFIEYTTAKPQTFGQSLERLGFRPVARHRSREVMLYRQGDMNIIVNAHHDPDQPALPDTAEIAAVAFRVRDTARAYRRVLELGAWGLPTRVEVMELNIPAIHGVGNSRLYFVDRCGDFSIYDVDFVPIPTVDRHPPATGGLRFFGLVQYIGPDRMADWIAFYSELFGFRELPADHHFGILHRGCILASPCGGLYWQLIEPPVDAWPDAATDESLARLAFACADVPETTAALRSRGVEFAAPPASAEDARLGALTTPCDQGPTFELVREPR